MKISGKGADLIKRLEGLRLVAYKCSAGVNTIGYGHTWNVKKGQTINIYEAEQLLREDISPIERYLNKVFTNIKQCRFDALCSFIFNVGIKAFDESTLKKRILENASREEIEKQFMRWRYVKGSENQGLINRRKFEVKMFFEK